MTWSSARVLEATPHEPKKLTIHTSLHSRTPPPKPASLGLPNAHPSMLNLDTPISFYIMFQKLFQLIFYFTI